MQCPNCEAENRDEAKFCDECGFPLSGSIARVAGAASPKAPADREQRRPLPNERYDIDEPVFTTREDPANTTFEKAYESAYSNGVEPVFDGFEDPAPSDAFEAVADASYGSGEMDELPMSDHDYEAAAWQYEQTPTMAFDQQPDEVFGYGGEQASQPDLEQEPEEWASEFTMEMPRVGGERKTRGRDFRVAPARPQRSKTKLVAFIVAGLAVGAVVAVVVSFALGFWGGVSVPDVTGMTEADAENVLTADGFSVRTTQVKSDDTEGLVLIMDPGAGSRAPEGSEVVIHIATARFIPDIVGKGSDEAKALLEDAGYENVRYEMQKSDGDENVVLEVSPEEGTRAKSNAEIIVKISEAYRVPNVEGLSAEAAVDAISDAGLSPEVVYIDTDQFPDGAIIGTNPEAGAKVSEGEYVSVSVARARGVELVGLTESMFSQGSTVTVGGVDYEIESLISVSYQGDETVAFTATGRPKITFFGETLYASSSQTITGFVVWSEDNEVVSIS